MRIYSLLLYTTPFDDTYKNVPDINNIARKNEREIRLQILNQIQTRYFSSQYTVDIDPHKGINFEERGGKVTFTLDTDNAQNYFSIINYNYAIVNGEYGYFIKGIRQINSIGNNCSYEAQLELDIWTYCYPIIVTNGAIESECTVERAHDLNGNTLIPVGLTLPEHENISTYTKLADIAEEKCLFIAVKLKVKFDIGSSINGYYYKLAYGDYFSYNSILPPYISAPTFYIPFAVFSYGSGGKIKTTPNAVNIVANGLSGNAEAPVGYSISFTDFYQNLGEMSPLIDKIYFTYNVPFKASIHRTASKIDYIDTSDNSEFTNRPLVGDLYYKKQETYIKIADSVLLVDMLRENKSEAYAHYLDRNIVLQYEIEQENYAEPLLNIDQIVERCYPLKFYPYKFKSISCGGTNFAHKAILTGQNDLNVNAKTYEGSVLLSVSQSDSRNIIYDGDYSKIPIEIDSAMPFYEDQFQDYMLKNANKINAEKTTATQKAISSVVTSLVAMVGIALAAPTGGSSLVPVAGVLASGASGLSSIASYATSLNTIQKSLDDAENLPSILKNNAAMPFLTSYSKDRIYIAETNVNLEEESTILFAKEFYEFGSKYDRIVSVFANRRKVFDYCKAKNCDLSANINKTFIEKINEIFNRGVTKWHLDTAPNNVYVNALNKHSNNQDRE